MADVRGDSYICIEDKTGTLKTVILEGDYERLGYKAKGWKVLSTDWTKERQVRKPVDAEKEMKLETLVTGERASD